MGKKSKGGGSSSGTAAHINRSNQLNPNHPSYLKSRMTAQANGAGHSSKSPQRSSGMFQHAAEAEKHRMKAVKDVVPRVEKIARSVCGSDAHLLLRGSAAKKVATRASDRDYLLQTKHNVTRGQRKAIVSKCQQDPLLAERYTEIRAKTNAISFKGTKGNPDLDLVPQDVAYQQGSPGFEAHKQAPPRRSFGHQALQNAVIAARTQGFTDAAKVYQVANAVQGVAKRDPKLLQDHSGKSLFEAFVRGGPSSVDLECAGQAPTARQQAALQQQFNIAKKKVAKF